MISIRIRFYMNYYVIVIIIVGLLFQLSIAKREDQKRIRLDPAAENKHEAYEPDEYNAAQALLGITPTSYDHNFNVRTNFPVDDQAAPVVQESAYAAEQYPHHGGQQDLNRNDNNHDIQAKFATELSNHEEFNTYLSSIAADKAKWSSLNHPEISSNSRSAPARNSRKRNIDKVFEEEHTGPIKNREAIVYQKSLGVSSKATDEETSIATAAAPAIARVVGGRAAQDLNSNGKASPKVDHKAFNAYLSSLSKQSAVTRQNIVEIQDKRHPIVETKKAPRDTIITPATRMLKKREEINFLKDTEVFVVDPCNETDTMCDKKEGDLVVARFNGCGFSGGRRGNKKLQVWKPGEITKVDPNSGTYSIRYFLKKGVYNRWYITTETNVPVDRIVFFDIEPEERKTEILAGWRLYGVPSGLLSRH